MANPLTDGLNKLGKNSGFIAPLAIMLGSGLGVFLGGGTIIGTIAGMLIGGIGGLALGGGAQYFMNGGKLQGGLFPTSPAKKQEVENAKKIISPTKIAKSLFAENANVRQEIEATSATILDTIYALESQHKDEVIKLKEKDLLTNSAGKTIPNTKLVNIQMMINTYDEEFAKLGIDTNLERQIIGSPSNKKIEELGAHEFFSKALTAINNRSDELVAKLDSNSEYTYQNLAGKLLHDGSRVSRNVKDGLDKLKMGQFKEAISTSEFLDGYASGNGYSVTAVEKSRDFYELAKLAELKNALLTSAGTYASLSAGIAEELAAKAEKIEAEKKRKSTDEKVALIEIPSDVRKTFSFDTSSPAVSLPHKPNKLDIHTSQTSGLV